MKIKLHLIYILLGAAFLGACAWVFLSRGRSAKAVRAKFRLGGMLLTITSMLGVASCRSTGGPFVTCYDAVVAVEVEVSLPDSEDGSIKAGDAIIMQLVERRSSSYSYGIETCEQTPRTLQEGELTFGEKGTVMVTLGKTDYTGKAAVKVFSIIEGEKYEIQQITVNIK